VAKPFFRNVAKYALFIHGYIQVTRYYEDFEIDYTKYLGKDYWKKPYTGKRVPTISGNHESYLDIFAVVASPRFKPLCPTLTPLAGQWKNKKDFPIGLYFFLCVQSIFIEREADEKTRDKNVEKIGQRQKDCEEGDIDYGPVLIFPEGVSHNGLYLHKFRRGAFTSERAIQPFIITWIWDSIHPAFDCIKGLPLGLMMCSEMSIKTVYLDMLPIFVPNDHLFTTYRRTLAGGEKMERWEVYAHALRDMMTNVGGFGQTDMALRDRLSY